MMFLQLMCLILLGGLFTLSHSQTEDYESCSYNYTALEDALFSSHRNKFLIRTVFFPPHVDNPLYVTVRYTISSNDSVDYIWSSANLYLILHPRIISFLSLFFSYIENNRVVHLDLELPETCSDLTNNSASDSTNFLFILTHRLRHYARGSTDLEEVEGTVVAAERHKEVHESQDIALFFSLAIGLPIAVLVLVWITVRGGFSYIRVRINDAECFPTVAALFWIAQTFTLFVIIMDALAISENAAVDANNKLQPYQLAFIYCITIVLGLGFFLNFFLALVPSVISHNKNVTCKTIFESYTKCFLISFLFSFKYIGRKEARVWLFLSSLLMPIIALSSHAGFIIGGWVSYEDRSIAILLLYLIIFIFIYWSLQYIYRFSTFVANYTLRKARGCCHSTQSDEQVDSIVYVEAGDDGAHHEDELASEKQTIKHVGFDSIAVFFMLFISVFLYSILIYIGLALAIPLLYSIDQAFFHIFTIGKYALIIVAFLLTYNALGGGGITHRLISNEALRYWKFLNRNCPQKSSLKTAMERLSFALKALDDDRQAYTKLLRRKKFDLKVVADHFDSAIKNMPSIISSINSTTIDNERAAAEKLKMIMDDQTVDLNHIENDLAPVQNWVDRGEYEFSEQSAAMKKMCAGINHFRKTLVGVMGIPPMHLKRDKASALTAALVHSKVSASQPGEGERLSLLLSLIEENF